MTTRHKRKLFGALAIACCWNCTSVKADIRLETDLRTKLTTVYISGNITSRDVEDLAKKDAELQKADYVLVALDSGGGDVFAAMRIGRIIRKYEGSTYIPASSKCYSSCALIYIAGVSRKSSGELGLHRPYLSSAPLGADAIEKQVPAFLSALKIYISEMRITDGFYERMVNTEPSQMLIFRSHYAKNRCNAAATERSRI